MVIPPMRGGGAGRPPPTDYPHTPQSCHHQRGVRLTVALATNCARCSSQLDLHILCCLWLLFFCEKICLYCFEPSQSSGEIF